LEYLTTPGSSKGRGKKTADHTSSLRNRSSTAKIVELGEDGEPLNEVEEEEKSDQEQEQAQDENSSLSELDPSHYWIIAFNTTWSSPCRHFEAVLARCSIT